MVHHFLSFHCFRMTDYPKNQYFSNHSPALTVQEFDNIYDKEITKRYHEYEYSVYQKERIESEILVQEDLSNWMLKIDF